MKLYVVYTPSHELLFRDWFMSSLKDPYELVVRKVEQIAPSGSFMESGWLDTMHHKIDLILDGIRENPGQVFVHSDVDVQFFRPTIPLISRLMQGKDFLVQRDTPWGMVCAGFFACRANEKTERLWIDIKANLGKIDKKLSDQDLLNHYLWDHGLIERLTPRRVRRFPGRASLKALSSLNPWYANPYHIRWAYLPDCFMSGGTTTGRLWQPGQNLAVPRDIVLHHANWTIGLPNKVAQLDYVRKAATR